MKPFSTKQIQLISLLGDGSKHSVADIMNTLYIGDPRSAIRDLRNRGIDIDDEWVSTIDGSGKYKRYWIDEGKRHETQSK